MSPLACRDIKTRFVSPPYGRIGRGAGVEVGGTVQLAAGGVESRSVFASGAVLAPEVSCV
jgi:hypothetical protein